MRTQIVITASAVLLGVAGVKSQVNYGIKAGVNIPKVSISLEGTNVGLSSGSSMSFYLTGYMDVPLASNLSLQPALSFQGKGGKVNGVDLFGDKLDSKLNSMYAEIPVNLVYYVPAGAKADFFIGAGPYFGIGFYATSSIKSKDREIKQSGSLSDSGVKLFDGGLNFLVGLKLTNGFLINAGYGLGLINTEKDTQEVKSKNRVFSVGVGYQF